MQSRALYLGMLVLFSLWLAISPPPALADGAEHVVQSGNTLFSLAAAHGTTVDTIARANGLVDPSQIHIGQRLIIPETGDVSMPDKAFHIVRAGETLFSIAQRYEVSPWTLARTNQLTDPSNLRPGWRLTVPMNVSESTANGTPASEQTGKVTSSHPNETGKWIDVHLSTQTLTAYEDQTPVYHAFVSSGLPATPTVTGRFRVWIKLRETDMYGGSKERGDDYYLEDVPYVQYFYEDYALHGTYWHNNFGQPMSRGCVNLSVADAKWLFEWTSPKLPEGHGAVFPTEAEPGTEVVIHK